MARRRQPVVPRPRTPLPPGWQPSRAVPVGPGHTDYLTTPDERLPVGATGWRQFRSLPQKPGPISRVLGLFTRKDRG